MNLIVKSVHKTSYGYLVTFDGSSDFDIFRNIFRDHVIQNPNITSSYKLLLLKQHLTGRASKCLYRLEDTEGAIRLTFKELESKYGRKSDKMTLHNKFGSIPFHHTDSDRMADDLRAHRMVLSEMKERGMNIDDEAVIKQFCTKLPGEMKKRVVEKFIATNGNLTFDMVHAIVVNGIEEIRIRESYFEDRGVDYDSQHTHPTNKADNNVFRNYRVAQNYPHKL
ncbi:hypothetical protein CRE_22615 [Caenorhabditis remanei]|uniref:Uncharacterized protein n=1 Tax=Caenorhabditis remanei TaxID=31234 RepID=E3N8Q5_CAERE|nr:hypothetical protein CRE_22615 [Caenorhabditis remanei]